MKSILEIIKKGKKIYINEFDTWLTHKEVSSIIKQGNIQELKEEDTSKLLNVIKDCDDRFGEIGVGSFFDKSNPRIFIRQYFG